MIWAERRPSEAVVMRRFSLAPGRDIFFAVTAGTGMKMQPHFSFLPTLLHWLVTCEVKGRSPDTPPQFKIQAETPVNTIASFARESAGGVRWVQGHREILQAFCALSIDPDLIVRGIRILGAFERQHLSGFSIVDKW
jgi:hypothetical protein